MPYYMYYIASVRTQHTQTHTHTHTERETHFHTLTIALALAHTRSVHTVSTGSMFFHSFFLLFLFLFFFVQYKWSSGLSRTYVFHFCSIWKRIQEQQANSNDIKKIICIYIRRHTKWQVNVMRYNAIIMGLWCYMALSTFIRCDTRICYCFLWLERIYFWHQFPNEPKAIPSVMWPNQYAETFMTAFISLIVSVI